ncbi:hypothetical protein FRUB_10632 [Fimbriiglobus ruber]|uniref:Uncharacterized protein n=2 Tax=Fimbriiglobus ruber TaxID=1908690 RepID=A0A225CZ90_9BACT|nr:hypothetical protein FRUB_10632 [Fimbriiglobus ruber]
MKFTDLNAVMAAVRGWCDAKDAVVAFGYYGYIPGEWEVRVFTPTSISPIVHSDLCYALLAACLEASRKLLVPA